MSRKSLVALFCLLPLVIYAQNEVIDSLEASYLQATTEEERIDLLNYIGEEFLDLDFNQTLKYARKALSTAEKIGYKEGIAHSYNSLGVIYDNMRQTDSAYLYLQEALKIAIELKDTSFSAVIKNNLGNYYVFQGNYLTALHYFQEALDDSYLPSGRLFDPMATYANIGVIHEEMGQVDLALDYYRLSAEAAYLKETVIDSAYGKLKIGYIGYINQDYELSEWNYKEALAIYRTLSSPFKTAETLYYLGIIYTETGEYEAAIRYHEEALEIYLEQGAHGDLPSMYEAIGDVHEAMEDYHKAEEIFKRGLFLARKYEAYVDMPALCEKLAGHYAHARQLDSAFYYEHLFQQFNDTLYNLETRERIEQLEIDYNLRVKAAENDRLLAESAKREALLQQRTLMLWVIGLIALLVSLIAYFLHQDGRRKGALSKMLADKVEERTKELQAANVRLLQSNKELERFSHIASHDLKEPLRGITSFLNLIQRKLAGREDPDLDDYMGFILSNTKQMYHLIEDVLAYSEINGITKEVEQEVAFHEVLAEVKLGLSVMIKEKNAEIHVKPKNLPRLRVAKPHVYLILKNLVENGLKYNESTAPTITIDSCLDGEFYHIQVSDNGIGINPAYQAQVFEMFKRLNTVDKYPGSGIGLAICKKIVLKYGGQIWFTGNYNQGTTFHFTFPAFKTADKKQEGLEELV